MVFRSSIVLKAFTLIELLIVIVIIGILATALIPRITGMQDKARYARVEKDFRDLRTAVLMAQSNTNKSLKDITWNTCTSCACGYSSGYFIWVWLNQLAANHACRTQRVSALRSIESAAWLSTWILSSLETDPWWSPYLLDENEMESGNCIYRDLFKTFWSDWFEWWGDDRDIKLAPMWCSWSY